MFHLDHLQRMMLYCTRKHYVDAIPPELQYDMILLIMYYLTFQTELLCGEGTTSICIADVREAPTESDAAFSLEGMATQIKLFGQVVGQSFPGTFNSVEVIPTPSWGRVSHMALSAAFRVLGQKLDFVTAADVEERYQCSVELTATQGSENRLGDIIKEFFGGTSGLPAALQPRFAVRSASPIQAPLKSHLPLSGFSLMAGGVMLALLSPLMREIVLVSIGVAIGYMMRYANTPDGVLEHLQRILERVLSVCTHFEHRVLRVFSFDKKETVIASASGTAQASGPQNPGIVERPRSPTVDGSRLSVPGSLASMLSETGSGRGSRGPSPSPSRTDERLSPRPIDAEDIRIRGVSTKSTLLSLYELIHRELQDQSQVMLWDAFLCLDEDLDGKLDRDEVKRLLKKCDANLTDKAIKGVIMEMEADPEGKVMFSELIKWWSKVQHNTTKVVTLAANFYSGKVQNLFKNDASSSGGCVPSAPSIIGYSTILFKMKQEKVVAQVARLVERERSALDKLDVPGLWDTATHLQLRVLFAFESQGSVGGLPQSRLPAMSRYLGTADAPATMYLMTREVYPDPMQLTDFLRWWACREEAAKFLGIW